MVFWKVAPTLSQVITSCTFRTYKANCSEYFQEIMTEDGLCFTFNSLTSQAMFMDGVNNNIMSVENVSGVLHRWTLEDGYESGYEDNSTLDIYLYPYRVLSSGSRVGLKTILSIKDDDMDYLCRGPVQGFKVILHSPNELPQVSGQYFRIPLGQSVRLAMKPNMIKTTKTLKGYNFKRFEN